MLREVMVILHLVRKELTLLDGQLVVVFFRFAAERDSVQGVFPCQFLSLSRNHEVLFLCISHKVMA